MQQHELLQILQTGRPQGKNAYDDLLQAAKALALEGFDHPGVIEVSYCRDVTLELTAEEIAGLDLLLAQNTEALAAFDRASECDYFWVPDAKACFEGRDPIWNYTMRESNLYKLKSLQIMRTISLGQAEQAILEIERLCKLLPFLQTTNAPMSYMHSGFAVDGTLGAVKELRAKLPLNFEQELRLFLALQQSLPRLEWFVQANFSELYGSVLTELPAMQQLTTTEQLAEALLAKRYAFWLGYPIWAPEEESDQQALLDKLDAKIASKPEDEANEKEIAQDIAEITLEYMKWVEPSDCPEALAIKPPDAASVAELSQLLSEFEHDFDAALIEQDFVERLLWYLNAVQQDAALGLCYSAEWAELSQGYRAWPAYALPLELRLQKVQDHPLKRFLLKNFDKLRNRIGQLFSHDSAKRSNSEPKLSIRELILGDLTMVMEFMGKNTCFAYLMILMHYRGVMAAVAVRLSETLPPDTDAEHRALIEQALKPIDPYTGQVMEYDAQGRRFLCYARSSPAWQSEVSIDNPIEPFVYRVFQPLPPNS